MLEAATLGQTLDKESYEIEEFRLRNALLAAQVALRDRRLSAVILFAGAAKAGSGESVNLLNEWMDPRWITTLSFGPPRQEALERPTFWRYWTAIPPCGRLGLFDGAWYQALLDARLSGALDATAFEAALEPINAFERTLSDDGTLILKFWMHLGAQQQQDRLKQLEADALTAWRVRETDWHENRHHADLVVAAETMIERTSTAAATWEVVEGRCIHHRSVAVGRLLLAALERHLADHPAPALAPGSDSDSGGKKSKKNKDKDRDSGDRQAKADSEAAPKRRSQGKAKGDDVPAPLRPQTVLDTVDFPSEAMPKEAYEVALEQAQGRLHRLQRRAQAAGVAAVLAFEGWDAAGKGGAIRRVTRALDARQYTVTSIAAPTDEERAHHYLWRFWRNVPSAGRVAIFDRTWYGRVLVERVEGFASEAAWRRAYAEINRFEAHLVNHGTVLVKIFLHITPDEQKNRFDDRENTPYKRWKITADDWRNRARRADYERAIHDMVGRTSTAHARWHLVPANDKRFARVRVLELIGDALEARLAEA
jgi:polyphosphate kinase 2 (PPK2 family)